MQLFTNFKNKKADLQAQPRKADCQYKLFASLENKQDMC